MKQVWEAIENLPEIDLAILKAHLLLEYWLNKNIVNAFPGGEKLIRRFQYFAQKVDLLEWTGYLPFSHICSQLREINSIRNDISHELVPDGIENKILAIEFRDIYGLEGAKKLDPNVARERLLLLAVTLVIQLANWSDQTKHEWASNAMS